MEAPSRLQGTAENAFPLDSQQSPGRAWSVAAIILGVADVAEELDHYPDREQPRGEYPSCRYREVFHRISNHDVVLISRPEKRGNDCTKDGEPCDGEERLPKCYAALTRHFDPFLTRNLHC
jgi:hypothetical protein